MYESDIETSNIVKSRKAEIKRDNVFRIPYPPTVTCEVPQSFSDVAEKTVMTVNRFKLMLRKIVCLLLYYAVYSELDSVFLHKRFRFCERFAMICFSEQKTGKSFLT